MAKKAIDDGDDGTDHHHAGSSCVWFTCGVFLASSVIVVFATASSSSSFVFQAPFKLIPFVTPAASENATTVVSAVSVGDLQKNIFISAAAKNYADKDDDRDRSLNSSSAAASPVVLNLGDEVKMVEKGLARARAAIRKAAQNSSSHGHVYRNPAAFFQSYREMEKRFKVYIYEEGEPPIVHDGPCKNIYSSEGRFIIEMEQGGGGKRFRTKDPDSAHAFFLPFSVVWMVRYLYKPNSPSMKPIVEFASDYVRLISSRYPFWNRTLGADHFMLSCHDWAPEASKGNAFLYNSSMRVLCNANISEGFNPRKDVSLPEVQLHDGEVSPKIRTPPPANNPRPYLAFFAGGVHGPIRPILLHHWKGKDPDLLPVYEYLPKDLDYYGLMLQSKFCLCPSGYEVASPRIVEAIYAECVPVTLSDHYVLPFSDALNWEAFSVKVEISQIPRLKEILMAIPEHEYMKLKEGLRAVRRHFVLNQPAKRFDMFHMILHSVWLRRLNFKVGETAL